jgi:S-disulfanyl-L-cysteine oxidoreductase SoxD
MSNSANRVVALSALVCSITVATAIAFAQQPSKPAAQKKDQQVAAAQPKPKLGLGREAKLEEIKAWDIDVRPDGQGLPPGKGNAKDGEKLFIAQCASCHGEFGEGVGRWPVLVGGRGTLKEDRPEKTVGSFWPSASTVFDYIKRAMPYGNAQSLTDDEIYALTAYLLFSNDIIKDEKFELTRENFASIKMPNADQFYDDDRETAEKHFWNRKPCMTNCLPKAPEVAMRARILDVTPDQKTGPKVD